MVERSQNVFKQFPYLPFPGLRTTPQSQATAINHHEISILIFANHQLIGAFIRLKYLQRKQICHFQSLYYMFLLKSWFFFRYWLSMLGFSKKAIWKNQQKKWTAFIEWFGGTLKVLLLHCIFNQDSLLEFSIPIHLNGLCIHLF